MERRIALRCPAGGGERIPAFRPNSARVATATGALTLSAAVVVYAVVAAHRLSWVGAAAGALGFALTALALPGRWPSLLPLGLAGVGGSYGVFLSLRGGDVDVAAPAVAAALYVAAELGFWSLERAAPYGVITAARRLAGVAAGAVAAALLGSLVLVATSGVSGGVGLEAAGVGAAVLTLAAIALMASGRSV